LRGHRDPSFGRVSDTKRHKLPSRRREPASLGPPACRTLRSMRNPARQPDEPGQRLGEADDMLPGTGPNFKHHALLRQNASQHLSDRHTIARGRRRELSRVLYRDGA